MPTFDLPLPFNSNGREVLLTQGPLGGPTSISTHRGFFATGYDFDLRIGDAILAFGPSRIVRYRDDLPTVGSVPSDESNTGNYVTLVVNENTPSQFYASFLHLETGSVSAFIDQRPTGISALLQTGDVIGRAGASGLSISQEGDGSHLHVQIGNDIRTGASSTYAFNNSTLEPAIVRYPPATGQGLFEGEVVPTYIGTLEPRYPSEAPADFEDALYVVDSQGRLIFYDDIEAPARRIIQLDEILTDVALAPDGRLYGITFDDLYRIDAVDGSLQLIGDLGLAGANALEITPDGDAYVASFSEAGLFTLDLGTAVTSRIAGTYLSAGDLVYTGDTLWLSDVSNEFVQLEPTTGAELNRIGHNFRDVFGLTEASEGLVAFAGEEAHVIDLEALTSRLLIDLQGTVSGQINGAAGAFTYDSTLQLTPAEAQTVAYLYEAALDRDGNIDLPGLNFWISVLAGATDLKSIAESFLRSEEFRSTVGDVDEITDLNLVEALYRNILNREGEAAGVTFWTDVVGRPSFDEADLLLAFAESPENRAGSQFVEDLQEIQPGFWDFV